MAYRLQSGSPAMTVEDVAARWWTTIIGCAEGHSLTLTPAELRARFPAGATLGQIAERLTCSVCGSRDGAIGFVQGQIRTDKPMQGF